MRGSGYDGTLNGSSGQIYLRDVTKPIVTGGWIYGGMGRGVLVTHCTAPEISELVVEKNQYEGITVDQSDGASLRGNHFVDNVRAENSSIDHVLVQASSGTITQNNVFDGDSGRSWLRIKGPGTDNLVARNSGVGDPPPNVMLADIDSTTATTDGITLIPRTS